MKIYLDFIKSTEILKIYRDIKKSTEILKKYIYLNNMGIYYIVRK